MEVVVREGDPVTEIVGFSSFTNQDFIILGPPGSWSGSWQVGARVVNRVISEARCPVIVVRSSAANANNSVSELSDFQTAAYGW